MFLVSVEYPIEKMSEVQEVIEKVVNAFGCDYDAGTDLSIRDVSFHVEDEGRAWEVLTFLQDNNPSPINDSIISY